MVAVRLGRQIRCRPGVSLRQAATSIYEQATGHLNIAGLAKDAGLSVSHFRRVFREVIGCSPHTLFAGARIQRGCRMLMHEGNSISQIADDLGYSTVHNFSRAFKKVVGVSPRQYRDSGSVR